MSHSNMVHHGWAVTEGGGGSVHTSNSLLCKSSMQDKFKN